MKIDIILLNETHLSPNMKRHITINRIHRNNLPPDWGKSAHGVMSVFINRRITHQFELLKTDIQTSSVRIVLNGLEVYISIIHKLLQATLKTDDLKLLTKSTVSKNRKILTPSTPKSRRQNLPNIPDVIETIHNIKTLKTIKSNPFPYHRNRLIDNS